MKKAILLTIIILGGILIPKFISAQWSSDPYENIKIQDTAGMIIVPHIVVRPEGDCYISWYSATHELRFDVYLQYFDKYGNAKWPQPGLLVSNHETDTWVSDYGLAIDQEGCAVLITQDQRDGVSNSFAYRVSPEGQMKWGPDGIRITDEEYYNYTPQVTVTPDNGFIFLNNMYPPDTTQMSLLNLKKLNSDGNLVWEKTLAMNMMDLYFGRMLITEDENLILSYLDRDNYPDTVMGQAHFIHVYLQKFDLDGNSLWPAPVQADTGDVMIYGALYTIPYLANDGNDGAYVVWQSFAYDSPTTLVNHIDAGGNLTWPGHGIPVSTNYDNHHTAPSMVYNPDLDNLFVFWQEYQYDGVDLADCWAVGGQKFSAEGERLWSDTAKYLVPMICAVDTAMTEVHLTAGPDNSLFFTYTKDYLHVNGPDTTVNSDIYASLADPDGNYLWSDEKVAVCLAPGVKYHNYLSEFQADQWILAWDDHREHSEDPWNSGVYAQNVTIDGNLGPLAVPEPGALSPTCLRAYPNPFTNELNVEYFVSGKSEVSISLADYLGRNLVMNELGIKDSGNYSDNLSLKQFVPGIYFLNLQAGEMTTTLKVVKSQ
jgi:hypothetical protein